MIYPTTVFSTTYHTTHAADFNTIDRIDSATNSIS